MRIALPMRITLERLAMVIVVVFVLGAVRPEATQAAIAQCDRSPSTYFNGYYHDTATHTNSFEGASGFIVERSAYTCDSDHSSPNPSGNTLGSNFTTAWVMIADYYGNSWSQVGLIAGWNELTFDWAEVVRGYNPTTGTAAYRYDRFLPSSVPPGTRQAFYEQFLYGCPAPTNHACEESWSATLE